MSDPTSIELPAGSLKERCERFGIPWLDEAPELDLELAHDSHPTPRYFASCHTPSKTDGLGRSWRIPWTSPPRTKHPPAWDFPSSAKALIPNDSTIWFEGHTAQPPLGWPKTWPVKRKTTITNTTWMPSKRMTSTAWRSNSPHQPSELAAHRSHPIPNFGRPCGTVRERTQDQIPH